MLTKNFHKLQTEVQRHVSADRVKQGSYDTCLIGCLAEQKNSPEFIEREYGIPENVSLIAESIFDELPADEAPLFFAAFPGAVECDGKDLSRVPWQFFAAELRLLPPVTAEVQGVIDPVIKGIDLLAEGEEWSEEDARAAATEACQTAWVQKADADRYAGWAASNAAVTRARRWAWPDAKEADMGDTTDAVARAAGVEAADDVRRRQRDLLLTLIAEAPVVALEVE